MAKYPDNTVTVFVFTLFYPQNNTSGEAGNQLARLDRYILSQLIGPFAIFSLILIGVYWVGRAIGLFDQLIGDGQSLSVFIEIMALFLPRVVAIVLPVVSFAASVYVCNRLHSESEMVVLQSSGLSPVRLMRPFLIFSLLVAVFAGVLSHYLVPVSLIQLGQRQSELAEDLASRMIVGGRFLHPNDGVTFYASEIGQDGSLIDIFLHDQRGNTRDLTYTAHKAVLVRTDTEARLVMYEGLIQTLNRTTQHLSKIQFDEFLLDVSTLTGRNDSHRINPHGFSTFSLLFPTPQMITQTGVELSELKMLAHQRLEQPLQSLIYPLIGMAMLMVGSFSRFGVFRQIAAAIAVVITLSTLSVLFRDQVWSDISLWPLMYLADLMGAIIIAFLLYQLSRPSRRGRAVKFAASGAT